MWTYVVCLGFGMLIDPVRIGIAAALVSRRQALRTLLAFWVGGIAAGVSVAVLVLVLLHDTALVAINAALSAINEVRSAVIILSGANLKTTIGVLVLVALAVVVARERARIATPVPVAVGGGDGSQLAPQPTNPTLAMRLAAISQRMLQSGFVWPAFAVGFVSTFPPVEGPMALTVIMASRAAAGTQLIAFLVFILLVLAFVEVPLVSFLVAPSQTHAAMRRMDGWLTSHRLQIIKGLLGVTGVLFLAQGLGII
jgi:hypothetical protein